MLPWLYIVLFLDSSVFLSLPICILFSIYLPLSVVSVYSVYKYLQRLMVLICSAHLVFRTQTEKIRSPVDGTTIKSSNNIKSNIHTEQSAK